MQGVEQLTVVIIQDTPIMKGMEAEGFPFAKNGWKAKTVLLNGQLATDGKKGCHWIELIMTETILQKIAVGLLRKNKQTIGLIAYTLSIMEK